MRNQTIVRKSIINLLNVLCKGDICLHENDKAVKYLGFCPITLCLLKLPYLCTNKFINRKVEFRETEWCSLESWDCLGRSDSATCGHCILHAPFLLPKVKKNGRNAQPPFPLIHLLPGSYQREAGSQAAGGYPPFMSGWGHKTRWRMVFKSRKEKEETRCKGPREGICCTGSKVGDLVHWQRKWSVFTLPKPWDYLNHPLQLSHNCAQPGARHGHMQGRVRWDLDKPFTKERERGLKRGGGRKEGEEDKRGR